MSHPKSTGGIDGDSWENSRTLWREASPAVGLTWGRELSGEAFVSKAQSHGAFGPDKAVLEVGPGYGRLLRECVGRRLSFRKYVAVDISPQNVDHLGKEFDRLDVLFVLDDIETVSLDERFDTVFSSLTLKHLYPSFETALRNVERHLNPLAVVIFDLLEAEHGERFWIDRAGKSSSEDRVAYIRTYSRSEVEEILGRTSLELVAFDEVQHDPENARLLVVARKPD